MLTNASLYQIALTRIEMVGVVKALLLIAHFGGAEEVFRAKKSELLKINGVGPGLAEAIKATDALAQAESELEFMEKNGVVPIFFTDPDFPSRLRSRRDCPIMVFFKGSDVSLLDAQRMVAIVGTRNPTEHGKAICEEITQGLSEYNVTLVSGLAYGIDITAHRKACAVNMPNIGVLGHGLGRIYPADHKKTAFKMMEHGGLLTEYLHETGPDREHFPMRNRIISGLCDALIVVESAASGGSMISAEFALKHHLEVFAVPGRPSDPNSEGCNGLIKSNKARLIEKVTDLAESMNWEKNGQVRGIQTSLFNDLSESEQMIVNLIRENPGILIDDLLEKTQMPGNELSAIILRLELSGIIKTQPGKRYKVV